LSSDVVSLVSEESVEEFEICSHWKSSGPSRFFEVSLYNKASFMSGRYGL